MAPARADERGGVMAMLCRQHIAGAESLRRCGQLQDGAHSAADDQLLDLVSTKSLQAHVQRLHNTILQLLPPNPKELLSTRWIFRSLFST